ncbi:MAG TPA: leucyl aminopeptidase family protein [Leptolinea sp.]
MKIEDVLPIAKIQLKSSDAKSEGVSELKLVYSEDLQFAYPTGKKIGSVTVVPHEKRKFQFLVSLGEQKKANVDSFRKAGAAFARWCNSHPLKDVVLDVAQSEISGNDEAIRAVLEGLCIGSFEFDRYKTVEHSEKQITLVYVLSDNKQKIEKEIQRAAILGEAVDLARDWIHEPANKINPQILEERVQAAARHFGLSCKVIPYDELINMGAGGIAAVGRGSQVKPRLILVEYNGNGSNRPIALIGKAITFDTGGYSLKGTEFIQGMKYDKAGGISVLVAIIAAARLKMKVNLVAVIPTAENMISGDSYRPDDILTTLSGLTVEIVSTDAEGRLILADALTYAQNIYKPSAMIDIATLTGGVRVALGSERAGLLANSDHLAKIIFEAGEEIGEKVWRLPLDEAYFDLIKSEDADMKNSGSRDAQTIVGAIFLKQVVKDEIPWAHLDIAATGESSTETAWSPKGANGFGVRLMVEAVEKLIK